MTETEFLHHVKTVWQSIETRVDQWADQGTDVESIAQGPVLEIAFESGAKIVVNPQTPMQQIWLASPNGAFHFQWNGQIWADTRSGTPFWTVLDEQARLLGVV
jgi:CyaY protein